MLIIRIIISIENKTEKKMIRTTWTIKELQTIITIAKKLNLKITWELETSTTMNSITATNDQYDAIDENCNSKEIKRRLATTSNVSLWTDQENQERKERKARRLARIK